MEKKSPAVSFCDLTSELRLHYNIVPLRREIFYNSENIHSFGEKKEILKTCYLSKQFDKERLASVSRTLFSN